jgi:hypothetical protein
MNVMKLIDEANCATTFLDLEQWTVRKCPNGMAIFHKDNCRCCNDYACREQSIDLPIQAVGDAITMVWPMLMHDLKSKA